MESSLLYDEYETQILKESLDGNMNSYLAYISGTVSTQFDVRWVISYFGCNICILELG